MTPETLPEGVRTQLWHIYTGRTARMALVRIVAWVLWTIAVFIYTGVTGMDQETEARIFALAFTATLSACTGRALADYVNQRWLHRELRDTVRAWTSEINGEAARDD